MSNYLLRSVEWFWSEAHRWNHGERRYWLRRLAQLPRVPWNVRPIRFAMNGEGPSEWCWLCQGETRLNWHHIVPVSCGGETFKRNLVSLCGRCHLDVHHSKAEPFDFDEMAPTRQAVVEQEPYSPYCAVVLADVPEDPIEARKFFEEQQRLHDYHVTAMFEASF